MPSAQDETMRSPEEINTAPHFLALGILAIVAGVTHDEKLLFTVTYTFLGFLLLRKVFLVFGGGM